MSDQKENRKTKKRILIAAFAIVLAVFIAACAQRGNSGSNEESEITEAQVTRMTIENDLESDGQIVSALEENVLPHTSYYLEKINVEKGDALKEDDVILTYTNGYKMEAPYDCVVEDWDLPEVKGQLTSDHYVTIAGVDVMQMELSVSEEEVAELELGEAATVTVEATGKSYDAEVSYISQAGSYSGGSSTFTARVSFDNDGSVKLGMSATADIPLSKAENVLAVPVNAVSTRGGKSYVTVKTDEEETPTEVETGISNGSFIEIKSGLNEGDTVLVMASEESSSNPWGGGMPGGSGEPPDMGNMPSGGMPGGSGSRPGRSN